MFLKPWNIFHTHTPSIKCRQDRHDDPYFETDESFLRAADRYLGRIVLHRQVQSGARNVGAQQIGHEL